MARNLHGYTKQQVVKFFDRKQDSLCAICGHAFSYKRKRKLDHCHRTGHCRGLLCNNCNVALGLFRDNTLFLRCAIEYLNNANNKLIIDDFEACKIWIY